MMAERLSDEAVRALADRARANSQRGVIPEPQRLDELDIIALAEEIARLREELARHQDHDD